MADEEYPHPYSRVTEYKRKSGKYGADTQLRDHRNYQNYDYDEDDEGYQHQKEKYFTATSTETHHDSSGHISH